MKYLLKRVPDGAWVADMRLSPTGSSYTKALQYAQVFDSVEQADKARCPGNEMIVQHPHFSY